MGSGRMDDSVREEDGLAAGDPDWVVQQLMTKYRIDLGILTGSIIGVAIQHDWRFQAALVSAYNDWTLAKWVRPYDCYKGSIAVAAQEAEGSAREIHRLGDHPGMVQVLMPSAARLPYGNPHYWPIYRAAVEYDLPVAIHVGSEGTGIANAPDRRRLPDHLSGVPHRPLADDDGALRQHGRRRGLRGVPDAEVRLHRRAASAGRPT